MRKYLSVVYFIGIAVFVLNAEVSVREFGGMRATYNGSGVLTVSPSLANNIWKISISGVDPLDMRGRLSIKPTSKNKNTVFIDSISCDGSLSSISITFPPGKQLAGCLRNLSVKGFVKTLKITGGDLGAPDGYDGIVSIKGYVNLIMVKGKKYNVPNTTMTEFWGGNIWADLEITDMLKKIMLKGGNLYYTSFGGVHGTIEFNGMMTMLAVDGVTVKTNRADSMSSMVFGGGMNTDIFADRNVINQIRVKGGVIYGGGIYCRNINKLAVTGQKLIGPRPVYSPAQQGIFNTLVETLDPYMDFKDCSLKSVTVMNGSVRDSLFAAKGHMNKFMVKGDVSTVMGDIENVEVRVGYEGTLGNNQKPEISPIYYNSTAIAETPKVIPFKIKNPSAGETMTVRIDQRGPALDAVISNYNGETFSDNTVWTTTDTVQSGMFVWTPAEYLQGLYSNITVRVIDNGTPNLYEELYMILSVVVSNVAPVLVIDPPDTHRIYSMRDQTNLDWHVTIQDLNLDQTIVFSVTEATMGPRLGLVSTSTGTRKYHVQATNVVVGVYSNIVFKATDGEGLSDTVTLIVTVTSNAMPVVTTTLPANSATLSVSNTLSFYVQAADDEVNNLTFPRPIDLPAKAAYTAKTVTGVSSASNAFSWIPGTTDTGTFSWVFDVYDSNPSSLTGSVTVTVTVTNGQQNSYAPKNPSHLGPIGTYAGNINSITVAGSMFNSEFISGAIDSPPDDWAHATYLGRINRLNVTGTVLSNIFVSGKNVSIKQEEVFDFDANDVWIDGTRETGPVY